MIPRPFEYHAPASLEEALRLLADHAEDGKVLAGGHSLLPMMKLRFAQPAHLIDLGRIDGLRGIRIEGDEIRIGAMTTEHELLCSSVLREHCPLLVEAAGLIGDPQVPYKVTIGGDISNGDPGNDHPAIMLCLGASFVLRSARSERSVAADAFFLGTFSTAVEPHEIPTEIRFSMPVAGSGWCYAKLKRKTGDFATAATAVLLQMQGDIVSNVSIALTNLGATALKARDAEACLRGRVLDDSAINEAASLAISVCEPVEDLRGSIGYKLAMAGEMTRRALCTAAVRAHR